MGTPEAALFYKNKSVLTATGPRGATGTGDVIFPPENGQGGDRRPGRKGTGSRLRSEADQGSNPADHSLALGPCPGLLFPHLQHGGDALPELSGEL